MANKKTNNYKENNNNSSKKKVEKKEEVTDTTSLSVIAEEDLDELINEDMGVTKKESKHILVHLFLILLLSAALGFFGLSIINEDNSVMTLINNLLITLFTIIFVVIGISYHKKSKVSIFIGGVLLLGYFLISTNASYNIVNTPLNTLENFNGKSLTYAVKWAEKNNITINQEYEYSDMIDEYYIIGQDIKSGTLLKDVKELTLSISEGPNPSKEIIVPNMVSWDAERVLEFINKNHLTNVEVEFVSSEKPVDTVIEQSKSGTLKRDAKIKLKFSYGEELGYSEVKLIDFTSKTKFEVEFYMKQHKLRYEFDKDFSKNMKRGLAIKQSIKPGKKVKVDDTKIKVTISKGPKIKVPNLKNMSMSEITAWATKNKLRLEFTDKYDDTVKNGKVISANYKENDVVEERTTIKVTLSRGTLKMPKFNSFNDFREWADKYDIKYEEKHVFSEDVEVGEIISFSYKKGQVIKNNDTIIVKISDGKKCEAPNLKGLTKKEAISKLENAKLKYNFVYDSSYDVAEGKVMGQSISSGSELACGTTVTVTLSSGKPAVSSSKPSSSKPAAKPAACDRSKTTTVYIYDELLAINNPSGTCSKIKQAYGSVKFSCSYVAADANSKAGMLKNSGSIDGRALNHCDTYSLVIYK